MWTLKISPQQVIGDKHSSTVSLYITHMMVKCLTAYTHTHPFNGLFFRDYLGGPVQKKVKQIWILLKQETVASAGLNASQHLTPDR